MQRKKRSDELYQGMVKTFPYAAGRIDEEMKRPYIGIANTWTNHFGSCPLKSNYTGSRTRCLHGRWHPGCLWNHCSSRLHNR